MFIIVEITFEKHSHFRPAASKSFEAYSMPLKLQKFYEYKLWCRGLSVGVCLYGDQLFVNFQTIFIREF